MMMMMMIYVTWCDVVCLCILEVFCDVPGGILAARSLSEADDVTVMTSSVSSSVHRTCSVFESSALQLQLQGVQNVQQGVLHDLQGVQEERFEGVTLSLTLQTLLVIVFGSSGRLYCISVLGSV